MSRVVGAQLSTVDFVVDSTTDSTTTTTGAIQSKGGIGCVKDIVCGATIIVNTINELTTEAGVTVEGVQMSGGSAALSGSAVLDVNEIREVSLNNGVKIDGTLIKDGDISIGSDFTFKATSVTSALTANTTVTYPDQNVDLYLSTTSTNTGNLSLTGPFTATPAYTLYRQGDIVIFEMFPFTGTSTSAATFEQSGAIPIGYRPVVGTGFPIAVFNNGVKVFGYMTINLSGDIRISASAAVNAFAASGTAGVTNSFVNTTWRI